MFTQDRDRGLRFARQVQAGITHINDTTVNYEPNTAFGGEKDSGVGDRDVHHRPLDQRAAPPSALRLLNVRGAPPIQLRERGRTDGPGAAGAELRTG